MRRCIVCTGELDKGFVDERTGNMWCDEICMEIDYKSAAQKEAIRQGLLVWKDWTVQNPCERCGGRERADGCEYCEECNEDMQLAVVGYQQLELEIGSVSAG